MMFIFFTQQEKLFNNVDELLRHACCLENNKYFFPLIKR